MSAKTGWFDHGSNWEPSLLMSCCIFHPTGCPSHSHEVPVEPEESNEYIPHEPQRASVDHEWPIELGGEG